LNAGGTRKAAKSTRLTDKDAPVRRQQHRTWGRKKRRGGRLRGCFGRIATSRCAGEPTNDTRDETREQEGVGGVIDGARTCGLGLPESGPRIPRRVGRGKKRSWGGEPQVSRSVGQRGKRAEKCVEVRGK